MAFILNKLFRTKEDAEKDAYIARLKLRFEYLQRKVFLWKTRNAQDKELIHALQKQIRDLWWQVEDARDMLFSEISCPELSFTVEGEMFKKLESELRSAKDTERQLIKLVANYDKQQRALKDELILMNTRIAENKRVTNGLRQRKEAAKLVLQYWRSHITPRTPPNSPLPATNNPRAFKIL